MNANAANEDRAAVGVVRRMIHELEVRRYKDVLSKLEIVIRLNDFFRCVVGKLAIADDKSKSSRAQIIAMVFR